MKKIKRVGGEFLMLLFLSSPAIGKRFRPDEHFDVLDGDHVVGGDWAFEVFKCWLHVI